MLMDAAPRARITELIVTGPSANCQQISRISIPTGKVDNSRCVVQVGCDPEQRISTGALGVDEAVADAGLGDEARGGGVVAELLADLAGVHPQVLGLGP